MQLLMMNSAAIFDSYNILSNTLNRLTANLSAIQQLVLISWLARVFDIIFGLAQAKLWVSHSIFN